MSQEKTHSSIHLVNSIYWQQNYFDMCARQRLGMGQVCRMCINNYKVIFKNVYVPRKNFMVNKHGMQVRKQQLELDMEQQTGSK